MTIFLRKALLLVVFAYAKVVAGQTHQDGLEAMQLEDWDKAISIFSNLTKTNPADQDAWLSLGSVYLEKNNDTQKALEAFQAGFNAKAEGGAAYVANARILLLRGQLKEADEQFERALKKSKKDPIAMRHLGETFLYYTPPGATKHNYPRAEQYLKEAFDAHNKNYGIVMALAFCYKEMGNGGLSAQHYEMAAALQPKNPLPLYMTGKVYRSAKLYDKFVEFMDRTLALDAKNTPAMRSLFFHYFEVRKWEKALEAGDLLMKNGTNITIDDEMQYANILFINKKYKECVDQVDKILKKDSSRNYLRRLLIYCAAESGDYDKAKGMVQPFWDNVPADKILPSDYEYRAKIVVKTKGDTTAAIEDYLKVIELTPERWALNKDISDLHYSRKAYCNSAISFQTYLDSVPKPSPNDLYLLGVRHYYCKDDSMHFEKALATFVKITETVPTALTGWLWAGKSASKLDVDLQMYPERVPEFGKAKPYFDKYIELATVDAEKNKKDLVAAYEYNAYYYFVRDEIDPCKSICEKLIQMDPENKTANGLMQELLNSSPSTPFTPGVPKSPGTPTTPKNNGGKN